MKTTEAARAVFNECVRNGVLQKRYHYLFELTEIESEQHSATKHAIVYYALLKLCLDFGFDKSEILTKIDQEYFELFAVKRSQTKISLI